MNNRTIAELERELHTGERESLDPATLTAIRRQGGRRRKVRRVLTATGTLGLVAALGLTLSIASLDETGAPDDTSVADERPAQLSPGKLGPLARRALAEVPGAVQVSERQVVVPMPDARSQFWSPVSEREIVGGPVPLGAKTYEGVTFFPAREWPAWLYDGTREIEKPERMIGTLDTGVLVEAGDAELACVSRQEQPCLPALLTRRPDGARHLVSTMVAEGFLAPGADLQVYTEKDYSTGSPGTLAIAGIHGTDVARVDFVTATGETVEGQVTTSVVDGSSMMWARVPGELTEVLAYDADGEVIGEHSLD